ncbi:uridine diphosphate-N-acetylglucosamine-binding protein YvcK [Ferrimicrobium sp.]|uniref:gluconeogenesis factor YvcK family protein n=1 Tax=Ferrimicrobium sp. TaxID=2926050 RepID=UPI002620DF75|nr:uridine diphosphate-N-acetylglucosamine-binding protein YvcK [Ferrimicrobium sp.]
MRAVALGGGHGLAASLEALRVIADEVTAIVGVADNGGSSGRLRELWHDCPALGDARLTVSNLLGPTSGFGELLEYRFQTGELAGHALGNLVLFGLLEKTGSLEAALQYLVTLGHLDARVLPASNAPLELHGVDKSGVPLVGQLAVHWSPSVERVWIVPDAPPLDEAIKELMMADLVVLGPGSLYTSVLATALSPGLTAALAETRGVVVFVTNLAPQEAETRHYDEEMTIRALFDHGIRPDVVLLHRAHQLDGVASDFAKYGVVRVWEGPLSEDGVRHSPRALAPALDWAIRVSH